MFRRRRKPEDFVAEIESHLALEADRLKEQALNQEQARTAARRAFGNTTLAAERFHEKGRWIWLDSFVADVRHTLRSLRKAPGFTATVLAALALGIGANTAMFTVIKTVLLDQLPYPDPDRIVNIGRPGNDSSTNMPRFAFLEQNNPGFEDLAAWHATASMNLSGGDRPEPVKVIAASRNYFTLFGARPILGRTFTELEDSPGGLAVLVVSYGLWQRRFGGRSSILGQSITLGGAPYTIIGVLSPGFQPYPAADAWVPLQPDPNSTNLASVLTVCGRLPPNITLAQANLWVAVMGTRYLQTHPFQIETAQKIQVALLQSQVTGDIRPALLILMGAVGLVLLIACANVANLLMARAASRQREIAIRAAIGAGRRRILRQLLTESWLLALAGGALGLALGCWGVRALLALTPGDLPRLPEIAAIPAIDPKVAAFSFLASLITGLLFGLAPALQLSRTQLTVPLKDSSIRTGGGRTQNRTCSVLVVGEIAVAVILLCGALLLIRSVAAMHSVSLGFDPNHLLTVQLSLAGDGYAESTRVDRMARDLVERTKSLPGVESAALASALPLWGKMDMLFSIPGRIPPGRLANGDVQWRFVSPDYFRVLRIPLLSGRLLQEQEPRRTVVISQSMARRYWPGANPVGHTIFIGPGLGPAYQAGLAQIVGVVGDVRERLFFDPSPIMYQTPSQIPSADMALLNGYEPAALLVRTEASVAPTSLRQAIQQVLLADHNLAPLSIRTMHQVSFDSIARQNFNLLLLSLFAALALLLAVVGIYGVMSYSVEQRIHEIGIRTALGANRRDTLRLFLAQALRMAVVGIVSGMVGAALLTKLLAAQLFAVHPLDPLTFIAAPLILLIVALSAAFLPAHRAARRDPLLSLRHV